MPLPDICRDDLLILLASMGVVLPKSTKIPDEALNKRLSQALDAAQQINVLVNPTLVNLSIYKPWSTDKTLLDATRRGNMLEAFRNRISPRTKGVSPAKENTFKELRQIIMEFAFNFEAKHSYFCLMDSSQDWGVYVRIVNVYEVNDNTPLLLLVYKEVHSTPDYPLMDTLCDLIDSETICSVQSTELERRAMSRLFYLNSKRLSSEGYTIGENETRKFGFRTSFVLPLGPLSMFEKGKLTNNLGCEVCGNINISRCNQCLSVAYCSKECQKEDWESHKATCRSLKGGTWRTVRFDPSVLSGGEAKSVAIINRLDPMHNPPRVEALASGASDDVQPPPNIHDNKIFLVKIQISLFQFKDAAHFLIYDRQKSFQVFWRRKDDRDPFDEAEEILGDELKMYRWARRLGDYDLGICLDRAPAQNPAW